MNNYLINFFLFVICLVFCISCEDESSPTELPPITQTGENTLGCMIEDELFVPAIMRYGGPDGINEPILIASYPLRNNGYYLSFLAHRIAENKLNDINLYLHLNEVYDTGIYNCQYISLKYKDSSYQYDTSHQGEINITYIDTINQIISGLFEFTLVNSENENELLNIKDGRFDLKNEY